MKNHSIIKINGHPELTDEAAEWFHQKWGIPKKAYAESMGSCKSENPVPSWYIVKNESDIIAGIGVIENDFHDRKDLSPNVCAVYVEKAYRNQGIAGRMLDYVCGEFKEYGFEKLYLVTNHTSFYERYGWEFLCMVQCDGEDYLSRLYQKAL